MRTTVTLDPDVQDLIETAMRERGLSFKQVLNGAVRQGLGANASQPEGYRFRQQTYSMGFYPEVNLDKALSLADQLEDQQLMRKLEIQK